MREYSTLSKKETEQVNKRVRQVLMTAGKKFSASRGSYADHTPEYRESTLWRMVLLGILGTYQCLRRGPEAIRANPPNLKTANNFCGPIRKILYPPNFPAIHTVCCYDTE